MDEPNSARSYAKAEMVNTRKMKTRLALGFAMVITAFVAFMIKAPAAEAAVSGEKLQILKSISKHLADYKTMQGEFLQTGPYGGTSTGVFHLHRPGFVRFKYTKPSPYDIVADGKNVAVRNIKLKTENLYPLSQTPLRFLLKRKLSLHKEKGVTDVITQDDGIVVIINDKTAFNESKLALIFEPDTLDLKEWVVTDKQGLDTSVKIFNTSPNVKQNLSIFYIDYTKRR